MIEVRRVRERLGPELVEALERDAVPVVVVGGCADWPGTSWTERDLRERLGAVPLTWKRSASGRHPDFGAPTLAEAFAVERGTVAELLDHLRRDADTADRGRRVFTGDGRSALRRRDGVTERDPGFAPLLEACRFEDGIPADRLYTMWAWLSGEGARTWLHYDNNACHNLNAQLLGRKSCVLHPPRDLARTRPYPLGGRNPAVNCCAQDLERAEVGDVEPDLETHVAELAAGDLLFLPAWWIHAFAHRGELNVNVNAWWRPARPEANVVAHRQALADAAARAGIAPGTPEAEVLGRLEAALLAG